MRLTDLAIRQLPVPAKGQKTYWDGNGFGVRVSQGGRKSFVVMFGTDRRLKTLGTYPDMALKTARTEAQRVKLGDTPQKRLDRLSEAREAFLAECETRLRPATVYHYSHFLNATNETYLSNITLASLTDTRAHSIASWKAFFNWCIRQGLVDRNPFAFTQARYNQRTRVLTPDELRQVWAYDYPPYSDYLKLQILTGQRIGQWSKYTLQDDAIVFPASVMKNRQQHTIPLTAMVAQLLPVPYFAGWSKAKARIDKHVHIDHWTVHDLRRTFSTIHASIGTPLHVTETILSHSSGTISGVSAIYNRHTYMIEMRQALETYEKHIQSIVAGPS